jgi:putative FmdB family regulatory protein
MPIYEYRCAKCGKVSEILQRSLNREEVPVCAHCGAAEMQKIISPPGSIIMGGSSMKGTTCCGREERCSTPPCSDDGTCKRDK